MKTIKEIEREKLEFKKLLESIERQTPKVSSQIDRDIYVFSSYLLELLILKSKIMKNPKIGKISEIKLENDAFLKANFSVKVSNLFTTITVGKRSFYFNPDGTFDGTGTDLS